MNCYSQISAARRASCAGMPGIREERLAHSLCHDALRLAEMAAPQMPDFSPQEMFERILPPEADRVASRTGGSIRRRFTHP